MTFDIAGLLDLWSRPHVPGHATQAAFGHFYTDPVVVNGASLRLADLVDRAIALQETFDDVESEVLDMVETEAAVTVVFRLSGRQSGIPLHWRRARACDRPDPHPAHHGPLAAHRRQGERGVDDR